MSVEYRTGVKQFLHGAESSPMHGLWYIFREAVFFGRQESCCYLWPDGSWQPYAQHKEGNAYYQTKEEAEKVLSDALAKEKPNVP